MENLQKDFVPYELSLKMKQLGFDEPCLMYWNDFGKTSINRFQLHNKIDEWCQNYIEAPLYQQAFRWFREKYNLHAEITWSPSYEYEPGQWSDAIYEITIVNVSYTKEWEAESPDMQRANGRQLTYEESELACLKKLIEIVEAL
jgi:hypothetical protein